ncbi:site-specific DNA-methyltransferase [Tichowtungia aerotolerans]|uniref:site-specific DNA-methyltransferase (adenine-specific) n=1 Tax=Tichowtungia aerotolerans TaxID=2697043 RepID=A0A6P1M9C4_9BACT|nr:site-specific DNA-methyltransferase [Tichowtungia aerotolerans]QHI70497.1 site-specific DNA-methyltransferase [Tichowtungia aerotolerans]
MENLDMKSPDGVEMNIDKIAALFPGCITEAEDDNGTLKRSVDFDLLRQELSADVVEGPAERYSLNWPGKREAIATANAPINKTLRPCREESVDFDSTENLYIEGDNLEALKLLQETYLGKVKMIYIDPPYNTGQDFIYADNFTADKDEYELDSGQKDEEGGRLVANLESNGRYHSDWLTMMMPRLRLSHQLLRDDGVMIISIDDNEVSSLRKLCDEVFGTENFIDSIIWKKRYGGGAKEKFLISVHEYALMYAKSASNLANIEVPLTEESIKRYYKQKDQNFSVRGPYRTHPLEATKSMGERKNLVFPIPAPDGSEVHPKRQWLWGKDRVEDALACGELEFLKSKSGGWTVHTKQYLKDRKGVMRKGKAFSLIDDVFTQHGTNEIIELFGNAQIFSFPKPSNFIVKLLQVGLTGPSDILVDYFSGSASSAHAVMKMNAADGGNRKYIMVQLPEACDEKSEAFKAGYKTIAEVGKERIRRAGQKIKEELEAKQKAAAKEPDLLSDQSAIDNPQSAMPDVGFRVLKVDESNMNDVWYTPDQLKQEDLDLFTAHIKEDRTAEDLLFQVMLDWGVPLSAKIEKQSIDGKAVWLVNENDLLACFDLELSEETVKKMAAHKPLRAVFRDDAFDDSLKHNVEQLFKTLSPGTEVKSI